MVLVIFINTDLLRRLLYTWIHRCVRYSVNRIITQSLGNFRPQSVVLGRVECREPFGSLTQSGAHIYRWSYPNYGFSDFGLVNII